MAEVGVHAIVAQLLGDLALVVLVVGAYTDLRWRIVPNKVVLPALAVALVVLPFTADWPSRVWGVGFVGLVYALRAALVHRPAGMGDAKLLLFLALALGFPALATSLGGACVLALGFYAVQIRRSRLSRADPIPLVPFIALGVSLVAVGSVLC
ncbi:MAG: A24 family peptidase [Chloroflexi bacterium]|nr:A24 family peptidase [Chloroflexota bacterium]